MQLHRPFAVLALALLLVTPALALGEAPSPPTLAGALAAHPLHAAAHADPVELAHQLAGEMAQMPTGPGGPGAWVAFAAAQNGVSRLEFSRIPGMGPEDAFAALYERLDVPLTPALAADVTAQLAALDATQREALGDLVGSLVAAIDLTRAAVAPDDAALFAKDPRRALLVNTVVANAPAGVLPAALVAEHGALAAALARVDRAAMAAAALVVADALERDLPALDGARVSLPFVLIGAPGDTVHTADYVLLVDESGNDVYNNHAGAGLFAGASVGVAVDQGDGDDVYDAATSAFGFGLAGVGVLLDEGGSDTYKLTTFGQGFGFAGVGVLYDAGVGDDVYLSPEPEANIGTIAGSLGGIGVLVDEGGADHYRQDGLDGFAYGAAQGIGVLADRGTASDVYESRAIDVFLDPLGFLGNFSGPVQVSAEVSGAAILFEEGGDDAYLCGERVRQGCQGAGGAGAVGLLVDLGGNDVAWMGVSFSEELVPGLPTVIFPMGQGAGYGPSAPGGTGILYDAAGTDVRTAEKWAQGYGTVGLGILLDEGGGADAYLTAAPLIGARADGMAWLDGDAGAGIDR